MPFWKSFEGKTGMCICGLGLSCSRVKRPRRFTGALASVDYRFPDDTEIRLGGAAQAHRAFSLVFHRSRKR